MKWITLWLCLALLTGCTTGTPTPPPPTAIPPTETPLVAATAATVPTAADTITTAITPTVAIAQQDWATTTPLEGDYFVLGNPDAPLLLIDYSDFLCSACRIHAQQVEPELIANYVATGQLRMAFSPVLDFGDGSLQASAAAECAGQQAPFAFWQMQHLLYERQQQVWNATPALLVEFASELQLDTGEFERCLADETVTTKIQRMAQVRNDLGIRSRPAFDLNGQLIQGALPYANFVTVLDKALADSQ